MLEQEPPREVSRQASLDQAELTARRRWPSLLAGVVLLAGCTSVHDVTGTATQQEFVQLRADVTALQLNVQHAKAETDKQSAQAESRAREETAQHEQQTADLNRRLEALSSSVSGLSARLDDVASRLEALNRRVGAAAPVAPRTAAPVTSGAPGGSSRPATGTLQPQDVYQAAYIDFSKGSYALAIAGFREFLRRYPDHELAGAAQYWVGEAYFSLARGAVNTGQSDKAGESLQQAVQEFKKVIANYPRSDKAPTSLYKEALALIELKQPALAQARLQYLIDNFPQAEETPLAKERLTTLKSG